jgi:hypothetical protein
MRDSVSSISTTTAALYHRLQRRREVGALTLSELRDGSARLADALTELTPNGASVVVAGRVYVRRGLDQGGLTCEGQALGAAVFHSYTDRAHSASDITHLRFADDFPEVARLFRDRLSGTDRAQLDGLVRAIEGMRGRGLG